MRVAPTLTALLFALCCARAVTAQTVRGIVLDSERSGPLVGAEVILLDGGGDARTRTFTDDTGSFLLRAPGAGSYRLLVSMLGHATYRSESVAVSRGGDVRVEVRMGVDAIPLEPFTVLARRSPEAAHLQAFNERRLSPAGSSGYFLTKEDIEKRPMATPTALLRQLPGVSVQQVRTPRYPLGMDRSMIFMSGGQCAPNIFVDGVRTSQSITNTVDDLLDGAPLAGIEVYPRALAAPLQYQVDPSCGVVLFWTARPGDDGAGWGLKRILVGSGVVAALVAIGIAVVN